MKKFNMASIFGMFFACAVVTANAGMFDVCWTAQDQAQWSELEYIERDVRQFCQDTHQMLRRMNQQAARRSEIKKTIQKFGFRFSADMNKIVRRQYSPWDDQQFIASAQCLNLLAQLGTSADSDDRETASEIARDLVNRADAAYRCATGRAFSAYDCPCGNGLARLAWTYCSRIHMLVGRVMGSRLVPRREPITAAFG